MSTDEREIRDLIARWHSATAAGDIDKVLTLMADDAVFLVAGQPPLMGRAKFEIGLRKLLESHRIDSKGEIREIRVSAGLAYCWTCLTVSITPLAGGNANVRSGSVLSIFCKRSGGAWVLVRDANLLPPLS
jgi:uncharacterized protein (TIGR02246 family)